MSKKSIVIFECDLCKKNSKPGENFKEWLEFSQNHPVLDRHWIDRALCPQCITDIQNAIKGKEIKAPI